MGHKSILSFVMKRMTLIHGKFRAQNSPMNFHFAVFMGLEMIFMSFSQEIHGILVKLQFIAKALSTHSILLISVEIIKFHTNFHTFPYKLKVKQQHVSTLLSAYKEMYGNTCRTLLSQHLLIKALFE